MKFKSKIDWWFHPIAIIMIVLMIWLCIYGLLERDLLVGIIGIVFITINALLIIPIWVNTYYLLDEFHLCIKCGLGKPLQISYKEIIGVKETRSFLSSPALSLDRLEIRFFRNKKSDSVYISPQRKNEFIKLLHQRKK